MGLVKSRGGGIGRDVGGFCFSWSGGRGVISECLRGLSCISRFSFSGDVGGVISSTSRSSGMD